MLDSGKTFAHLKTSLKKDNSIEVKNNDFSDHNTMLSEINNKRKLFKLINMWKSNNTLLTNGMK
jgi:hypothetical protein